MKCLDRPKPHEEINRTLATSTKTKKTTMTTTTTTTRCSSWFHCLVYLGFVAYQPL